MIYFIFQEIFEGKTQRASQQTIQKYFVIRFFLMTLVIFIFFFDHTFTLLSISIDGLFKKTFQNRFVVNYSGYVRFHIWVWKGTESGNWKWDFLKTFSIIIYIHIYLNACKMHPSWNWNVITLTFEFWSRYVISSQISNDFFYFKVLVGVNRNLGYKSYFSPKKNWKTFTHRL